MSISDISGATSPTGAQFVRIVADDRTLWVKKRLFAKPAQVIEILAQHDVVIPDKKSFERLIAKTGELSDFPTSRILERFGWNGDAYLFRDGTVIATADDVVNIDAELELMPSLVSGTLEEWFEHVVKSLRHDPLGLFALSLPFVAPLLRFVDLGFNPAFELIGSPGIGKTTLQKVALSVCGPWHRQSGLGLWSAHLGPKDDVQAITRTFSDHLLILDSRDSYGLGTTPADKRKAFKANAVKLTDNANGRLCVFSSSNQPLALWLGNEEAVASTLHHTLAIPLNPNREWGVFDRLPDDYGAAGELADDLARATEKFHGQALRTFLEGLVSALKSDPEELGYLIRLHMAGFRKKAGVDTSDGPSRQRADAFAMVYVGAALARRFGALPSENRIGLGRYRRSAIAAYRLHLSSLISIDEISSDLIAAASERGLVCGKGTTSEELLGASLLIKHRPNGNELWIKEDQLERLIPRWGDLRRNPDFIALFKPDKDGHLRRKRQHQNVALGRVAIFKLPAGWNTQESLFQS